MISVVDEKEEDKTPSFDRESPTTFVVRENSPLGSFVGIAIVDDHVGEQLEYSLVNAPNTIAIDKSTGILTVIRDIDHEQAIYF